MNLESVSIPIVADSGCCSDKPPAANELPIVKSKNDTDDCCHSSHPIGMNISTSVPPESCTHDSAPVAAEQAATEELVDIENELATNDGALIDALREVIDPELMINIVDLGLVYSINQTERKVLVEMTLTSPACPAGPQIISQAKMSLEKLDGVDLAEIKLTMSPPWTPDRMTDDARDQLGIF